MELIRELFTTALLAVLFSFIVAKLVSVVMANDCAAQRQPKSGGGVGLEQATDVEEVKFQSRLTERGCQCESRLEHVEKTEEQVHRIAAEPIPFLDVETKQMEEKQEDREKEVEANHQDVQDRLLEAVEPAQRWAEEEKPDQCCLEEPSRGGDASVERNSSKTSTDQACVAEFKESKDSKCETMAVEEDISKREGDDGDVDDDDDDDWEGIEKTELEKDFVVAANFVCSGETNYSLESNDVKMQLYGLHKVATEGPCHEPQPMALKVSARAKWNAWQRLGNMSPDVAMGQYITLLSENVPNWKEGKHADTAKSDAGASCNDLSTIFLEHPNLDDDRLMING
ncbi:hypothetical protein SAY86_013237 [Trapa natans]|uniref:ACB domain-containing protein n=1 Tax=Trapa natans TaxID=22666 RepID=A0AAN7REZ0_TRANT|nr:hypothetical protein SAY86_013237 [Trapa natans]